jgi:hypothetical protein
LISLLALRDRFLRWRGAASHRSAFGQARGQSDVSGVVVPATKQRHLAAIHNQKNVAGLFPQLLSRCACIAGCASYARCGGVGDRAVLPLSFSLHSSLYEQVV